MQTCPQCNGCGKVANTKDQEPWSEWMALPLQSAAAVTMGLVRPIDCTACDGSGLVQSPGEKEE